MLVWEKVKEHEQTGAPLAATTAFYHHKDYIYIFGGYYEANNSTTNEFYEFSLIKKEWNRINQKTQPSNRMGTSFTYFNDCLYLFSGWGPLVPDIWSFNLKENKWKEDEYEYDYSDEEHLARYYHFSITYDSKLYFVFGNIERSNERTNEILKYDPLKKQLEPLVMFGDVPGGRSGCLYQLCDHTLFIHGGFSGRGTRLNDTYSFNLKNQIWTKIETKGDLPLKKSGSYGIYLNNFLYLFGGSYGPYTLSYNSSAVDYTNEFHKLDLNSGTWTSIKSISPPSPRSFTYPFYYNGCLYLFGGNDKKYVYNEFYKIELSNSIYGRIFREKNSKFSDVVILCE